MEVFFKTIDYFGTNIGLKVDGRDSFKTIQGGILSILVFGVCGLLSYFFVTITF